MIRKLLHRGAAILLLAGVSTAVLSPAHATTFSLVNVTFSDGGAAIGTFDLNSYGYIEGQTIITTASAPFAGYTYSSGQLDPNSPPSNGFLFNSSSDFSLMLETATPLSGTSTGSDALIAGSANGSVLSGSYEQCTESACGGTGVYRLIDSGSVSTPEPATVSLLALGAIAVASARRRRRGGAA
jgi:hypothetical protein